MTLKYLLDIVFVQTALSAIVALVCFYRYNERAIAIKLMGYAFMIGAVLNVTPLLMITLGYNKYTNICGVLFAISTFTFTTLLYREQFSRKGLHWIALIVSFAILALINFLFFQKTTINSFSYGVSAFIILVYTIVYFYKLMDELPAQHIHHLPMFWINSAFLIFNAGVFFLFAFTAYIVTVLKNNLLIYWTFHNLWNILEHIIILVGLYYDLKTLPPKRVSLKRS